MIFLNGEEILIEQFPNGEARIKKEQFEKLRLDETNIITLNYRSDSDLFQLLLIRKALWFPIDLHIAYFPYSRMDRKSESHVFTLKSVAKFINWLDFNKVVVFDPHSDVIPALLNRCKIFSLIPRILKETDFDKDIDYILYPDTGAYKHYSDMIQSPHELIGIKKRDFKTGRINNLTITGDENVTGKRVFIIDDICSKGGTFVLAAEELKRRGASEIYLVIAHCEQSIFEGKIFSSGLFNRIYTSNSIISRVVTTDKLKILEIF